MPAPLMPAPITARSNRRAPISAGIRSRIPALLRLACLPAPPCVTARCGPLSCPSGARRRPSPRRSRPPDPRARRLDLVCESRVPSGTSTTGWRRDLRVNHRRVPARLRAFTALRMTEPNGRLAGADSWRPRVYGIRRCTRTLPSSEAPG
jgi:hypothetical protein